MPDYIWALHDFTPEHEDELHFKAGERIEVIERDDLYGDGWWQGRTEDGRAGLFPQAYTSPTPPAGLATIPEVNTNTATSLASLPEESDDGLSPSGGDNAVMAATMTDVQHAIDQLAVNRGGGDDTSRRTFSFIESGTDTDRETGDEAEEEVDSPGGWRGTSRQLLARNAEMANIKAAAAMKSKERIAPPIAVELSDESEAEEDDTFSPMQSPPPTAKAPHFGTDQDITGPPTAVPTAQVFSINSPPQSKSPLKEVAQVNPEQPRPRSPLRSPSSPAPEVDNAATTLPEAQAITTSSSKGSTESPVTPSPPGAFTNEPKLYTEPDVGPISASPVLAAPEMTKTEESKTSTQASEDAALAAQKAVEVVTAPVLAQSPMASTPSPAPSSLAVAVAQPLPMSHPGTPPILGSPASLQPPMQVAISPVQPTPMSGHWTTPWSAGTNGSFPAASVLSGPMAKTPSQQSSLDVPTGRKAPVSEWTVDQVVEWLRAKKFDEGIVSKFIENDITGDVLLELDVNMLKELDIPAFGKRMRIANAISELKRPSSFSSENSPAQQQMNGFPSVSNYNTSFGSQYPNVTQGSFNGGPLSNGTMHSYLQQQQYTQPSPTMSSGPFTPGGIPGYNYPSSVATSSLHTRNVSLSSSVPSGIAENAMDTTPSAATVDARPLHNQLSRVSEDADKGLSAADRSRSESDPGSMLGAVLTAASSAADASAAGDETPAPLRKGSLRSKPPLVTLTPTESKKTGWGGDSQITLGSDPSVKPSEQASTYESTTKGTVTDNADLLGSDRGAASDGEALPTLAGLKKRMSTRKAVRASASSQYTVNSDSRADGASTPVSSVPESPNMKGGPFSGTVGSRKKRHSDDTAGSGPRLSFFGGTLGKGRKPAPSEFSDTSPTVSSATERQHSRTLSRLYLGSQSRKSARPQPPPITDAANGASPTPVKSTPASPKKLAVATPPRTPEASTLRKRVHSSPPSAGNQPQLPPEVEANPGKTALDKIGDPDHAGWMRKRGESFNAWKLRYFVLKGHWLYFVKAIDETKLKGYIDITGYKVVADENIHPGRYGFRIVHDTAKPHYFSSMEQNVVREWMKALMKATIGRDYSRPVVSSCNIPTIPLSIAQAMNPAPRPPSPTARDATQRAMRRENTSQLSSRDALVLMGMAGEPDSNDKARLDNFFSDQANGGPQAATEAPPRPSRDMRKVPNAAARDSENSAADMEIIKWINDNLPPDAPPATDLSTSLTSGLTLFRLAENIKGLPTDLPDSAFPLNGEPEKLEGLFKLFDFMLDNDVRIGSVSINDVRYGNKEKVTQLVKSLKAWQERRVALAKQTTRQPSTAGPWMAA